MHFPLLTNPKQVGVAFVRGWGVVLIVGWGGEDNRSERMSSIDYVVRNIEEVFKLCSNVRVDHTYFAELSGVRVVCIKGSVDIDRPHPSPAQQVFRPYLLCL